MPFVALRYWLVVAAVLSCAGCRSKESLKRDCLGGEAAACRSACDKGITGDGGCFQVAREDRARAGLDFDSAAWTDAKRLFVRSCDGGHAEACVRGAEMLEAPYIAPDAPPAKLKTISDSEMTERQRLLSRACDLGSNAGCKRLGDVTIGKNSEIARSAHEKGCRSSAQPFQCIEARKREVSAFEHYRAGCKRMIADDCTALGNLVFRVDIPRAMRLFSAEADLRGVAPLLGGLDAFVRRRANEARTATVPDPTGSAGPNTAGPADSPENGAVPARARANVEGLTVEGRLPRTSAERALEGRLDELGLCSDAAPQAPPTKLNIEVIVDRTGDVWRVSILDGNAPERIRECVTAALSTLALPPPVSGVAKIRLGVSLGQKAISKQSAGESAP